MVEVEVEKGRVCVTGAGGFLASWVVSSLVSNNYTVHGTVRDPINSVKYSHLHKLAQNENENENECNNNNKKQKLILVKADLLDYDSLLSAIQGCVGVFHVASPVPFHTPLNPEAIQFNTLFFFPHTLHSTQFHTLFFFPFQVELLDPAVKGTHNVLKACLQANVKRLVYVSSGTAVTMNPNWPKHLPMDESCWSDQDFCRTTNNWYRLAKTQAETQALEFSRQTGLDVVSVCPTLILGPILQSNVNASTLTLLKLLKGGQDTAENPLRSIVDVRDVVKALVLAYEKPEAQGRYICTAHQLYIKDLMDKLKIIYPHHKYPNNFSEVDRNLLLSSEKLQRLGWTYRPLEETLIDSIESYRTAGLLD